MNKDQAIAALKEGKKLTHRFFPPKEYIYQDQNEIVHEDDITRISVKEFWDCRKGIDIWDMEWYEYINPIIFQSPDMIVTTYIYREEFLFQRMLNDQKWYVTYMNHIIAHGAYRHDLEEWIDITYPKSKK